MVSIAQWLMLKWKLTIFLCNNRATGRIYELRHYIHDDFAEFFTEFFVIVKKILIDKYGTHKMPKTFSKASLFFTNALGPVVQFIILVLHS